VILCRRLKASERPLSSEVTRMTWMEMSAASTTSKASRSIAMEAGDRTSPRRNPVRAVLLSVCIMSVPRPQQQAQDLIAVAIAMISRVLIDGLSSWSAQLAAKAWSPEIGWVSSSCTTEQKLRKPVIFFTLELCEVANGEGIGDQVKGF